MNGNAERRSQVSLARAPRHKLSEAQLREVVRTALAPLGGIEHFVSQGDRVLLKPNQTLFKPEYSGATTSPLLIKALVDLCYGAGAREVWVAEASGHGLQTRRVMAATGMAQAMMDTKAFLVYLEEVSEKVYDFGEDAGELRYMPAPEVMERANVIINVPKAKTHFLDSITGACKNWVGVVPMSYRQYLQREGEAYYRGTALFLRKFPAALTVVDGIIAGQGAGPSQNTPVHWGWILAATDPVAVDVTVARLFGLDWQKIKMARAAADLGLGVFDPARIDLVGASFGEAKVTIKPSDGRMDNFPARIIIGRGLTSEGTLSHWKAVAEVWRAQGVWAMLNSRGRPTFLLGDAEDPDFEQHLKEGPYVVLDDAARDQYKYDPRVIFIPGSPVPQTYIMHNLMQKMGFAPIYEPGLQVMQAMDSLVSRMRGRSGRKEQINTILKTVGAAVLIFGAPMALRAIGGAREARRQAGKPEELAGAVRFAEAEQLRKAA